MTWIGIDPGKNTGIAAYDDKMRELTLVECLPIHRAMEAVLELSGRTDVYVIFEDARQRTWFGERSAVKLQGAGSVKRDCTIWEDFLSDKGIAFRAIPPVKGATKLTDQRFKMITRWTGRSNEHSRDAAMLVFGR